MKNKPPTLLDPEFVTEMNESTVAMEKLSTRGKKKLINEIRSQIPETTLAEFDKTLGVEVVNNIILCFNVMDKRILKRNRVLPFGEALAELKDFYLEVFNAYSNNQLKELSDIVQRTRKHQCKTEDSQQKSGLLFSVEQYERLTKDTFGLGRQEGLDIGAQLSIRIIDLWYMVIDELIKYDKLPKQAGLKLRQAFDLAFSGGVRSLSRRIGKNLSEQLRLRLKELGLNKDDADKSIREQLAKEFGTNYATITDALSKIRSQK